MKNVCLCMIFKIWIHIYIIIFIYLECYRFDLRTFNIVPLDYLWGLIGILKLGCEVVHISFLPIFYFDFSHYNIDLLTVDVKRTHCFLQYYINVGLQTYLQMYFTTDFQKLVD